MARRAADGEPLTFWRDRRREVGDIDAGTKLPVRSNPASSPPRAPVDPNNATYNALCQGGMCQTTPFSRNAAHSSAAERPCLIRSLPRPGRECPLAAGGFGRYQSGAPVIGLARVDELTASLSPQTRAHSDQIVDQAERFGELGLAIDVVRRRRLDEAGGGRRSPAAAVKAGEGPRPSAEDGLRPVISPARFCHHQRRSKRGLAAHLLFCRCQETGGDRLHLEF
jgi:hypothetical protein